MNTPNIVLIVADTMRRDAISRYNENIITPYLERLEKDSVVFDNAVAPSPWTVPSHASLFTGKYPSEHGLHETKTLKDDAMFDRMNGVKNETIAEFLVKNGYNTVGISANPFISPGSGFDRGFNFFHFFRKGTDYKKDYLNDLIDESLLNEIGFFFGKVDILKKMVKNHKFKEIFPLFFYYYKSKRGIRQTLKDKGAISIFNIIKETSIKSPFFLFVNLMDMHDPYAKKEMLTFGEISLLDLFNIKPLPLRYKKKVKELYFDKSRIIDDFIGRTTNFLRRNNEYDDTLFIFTSDHGQALSEKDYYGHGTFLYDEIIRIPLMVKYPKNWNQPRTVKNLVSLTDIFPIIKETINGGTFKDIEFSDRFIFSESYGRQSPIDKELAKHKKIFETEKFRNGVEKVERRRKAVFYGELKLVINDSNEVEEFEKNYKQVKVNDYPKEVDELRERLERLD